MPGYLTHYLFGKQTLSKLKSSSASSTICDVIASHPNPFYLGCQGPDLFFYYFPGYITKSNAIGPLMHKTKVGEYFNCCLSYLERPMPKKKRELFLSYLSGLVCHYTLDSIAHPYVYARTDYDVNHGSDIKYLSKHFQFETYLDTILLKRVENKKPSELTTSKNITLNKTDSKLLAPCLADTIHCTYYADKASSFPTAALIRRAFWLMPKEVSVLQSNGTFKRTLTKTVEKLTVHAPILSSLYSVDEVTNSDLILNLNNETWCSPWAPDKTSFVSFLDLYEQAETLAEKRLSLLSDFAECVCDNSKEKLLHLLGTYSYNNGLPTN